MVQGHLKRFGELQLFQFHLTKTGAKVGTLWTFFLPAVSACTCGTIPFPAQNA